MIKDILFVGEEKSDLARSMGVSWKDGRLAAKQLFDALKRLGIDPQRQKYTNWFADGDQTLVRHHNGTVVAMGRKVERALKKEGIDHVFIYHPATRGIHRRKDVYTEHVRQIFENNNIL